MRLHPTNRNAGFTVSELIIGLSLSVIVLIGVLNAYIFVARSYTRTIGFGLPNEPTLEAQDRRTLATLTQDVQMTSSISAPSATEITLSVPRSTGGTKNVTYYYNGAALPASVYSVTVPSRTLVRIDRTTNTALALHSSLLTCAFTYYDASGNPYTSYTDYLLGIKQLSLAFTSRTGNSVNSTQTQIYQVASPRLLFRNKSLLP